MKTDRKPEELYAKLRDRFNSLAFGYGPSKAGDELVMIKRFFTPEDAEHLLEMPVGCFFGPADYAKATNHDVTEAEKILEDMSLRGLIYRRRRDNEPYAYRVVPMAHGVLEFNVDALAEDIQTGKADWLSSYGQHAHEVWGKQWFGEADTPFFRAVPVNSKLVSNGEVLPYDDAEELIRSHQVFAVSKCLCRVNTAGLGGFNDPRKEVCLAFDDMARYYMDVGIGREISMQDALDIINESIERGFCIHVANSKESEVMCSCDVNICGLLQMSKAFGGSAAKHVSHYVAETNPEKCTICGLCVEKCPAKACGIEGKTSTTDEIGCVGCGQCVNFCKAGARKLVMRRQEDILPLNDTLFDTYTVIEEDRRQRCLI
jgi:ferredoxin